MAHNRDKQMLIPLCGTLHEACPRITKEQTRFTETDLFACSSELYFRSLLCPLGDCKTNALHEVLRGKGAAGPARWRTQVYDLCDPGGLYLASLAFAQSWMTSKFRHCLITSKFALKACCSSFYSRDLTLTSAWHSSVCHR